MSKLIMQEGKLYLRKTIKAGGEEETQEGTKSIEMEEVIEAPTASAGCSRGMKLSRNYQSADVACWVTLPCADDPKEIKKTLKVASDYVEDHLAELVRQATKDLREVAG